MSSILPAPTVEDVPLQGCALQGNPLRVPTATATEPPTLPQSTMLPIQVMAPCTFLAALETF
jgi:hypothetical protein